MIVCNTDRPFPDDRKKNVVLRGRGYNFHCSAFFIFDTFEKLFDPKAFFVFASSLFRFFLRSLDSAGKLRGGRVVVWVRGVWHGSTENMQVTERGDIQFFTICSAQ